MTRRLIRPRRWQPPARVPTTRTAALVVTRRLPTGGHGPEDVTVHAGRIVTGTGDGRILSLDPATGACTVLGDTGGRPLGVEPCPDGSVLVCDQGRGLLRMDPDGGVEVLVEVAFPSNVVRGQDGTVWFTTSTSHWDLDHYVGDIFEHTGSGRLLRRDPDGTVTTLLSDLKFANGLVLAPDASHLLVAETAGYRVSRHWLTGPRAGRTEPLVENLPGFPDNMSLGSDGLLWVAIAAPRNALLDRLLPLPGVFRLLLWNLPERVRPVAERIAWVMAFDLGGTLVHDLRGTDGSYGFVTSVAEHDGTLFVGSLTEDDVAVVRGPNPGGSPPAPAGTTS